MRNMWWKPPSPLDLLTFFSFHVPPSCLDTEPPVIDRCRSPPTVQATDAEMAVVWEEPQFSDNSGMSGDRPPLVSSPERTAHDG